jgi:hypothetical protein
VFCSATYEAFGFERGLGVGCFKQIFIFLARLHPSVECFVVPYMRLSNLRGGRGLDVSTIFSYFELGCT